MRLMLKALALSTSCLVLTAASCEKRVVTNLKPPTERLQCVGTSQRPKVPTEYKIDWTKVATVDQAHAEHDKFVAVLRTRENLVAGYVLQIEGQMFACSNNMAWLREWYAAQGSPATPHP